MTLCLGATTWRMGTPSFNQALFVSSLTLLAYMAFASLGMYVDGLHGIPNLLEFCLPAYHGTSFMLSLLAAVMASRAWCRGSGITGFLPPAGLCVVVTFSDPLFITTFAIPFFPVNACICRAAQGE